MCKHKLIAMPVAYSGKPVSREHILAHGLGNLQLPFDVGSCRKLKERAEGAKQTRYCIDVVFNPFIVNLFMDDEFCKATETYRPFVINLALKRIEESVGVKLLTEKVKLVKSLRYKDAEDGDSSLAREFTELAGECDSFDAEMPSTPEVADATVLIEDVTSGTSRRKPAMKKGFLNSGSAELYGPNGSGEGVLPENAGDPMGWMPKTLRQKCNIVDCNSPEYQAQEKTRKAAEESNSLNNEFRESITKDMDRWCKVSQPDKWEKDLPEGTDQPMASSKYDVDYSRFDQIPDVEDQGAGEERDWYVDSSGQRRQIERLKAAAEAPSMAKAEPTNVLQKGFLDKAKKPLYPKGSEQAKAPPDENQLAKELEHLMGPASSPAPPPSQEAKPGGLAVKLPERKAPDFNLQQVPEGWQLVVSVPGLASMQGVSLDVTERQASMAFPGSTGLKPLQVQLDTAVIPTSARAKFSKKTQQITISLPVAVPGG